MTEQDNGNLDSVSMDTELGRVVVERGLATQDEVTQCLAVGEAGQVDPSGQSLAAIMVDKGFVTPGQLDRVKQTIEESRSRQQIPGYRLLQKLGAGAMATVYMAKQLSLDRTVAIKVLSPRLSENAEYVERFYREGKAAAKLNHQNIVQAFDVGEANGFHYFVMEYVEGRTLWDDLEAHKVFDETEAVGIILQVARALKHAHDQGLIHRDVKPKNIMITPGGFPKLADMGLARIATDVQTAEAEAGRAFGTPYYISPEQIRGEVDIDFRADIYSLGATLYHLVTGCVPFEAPTPVGVMQKHLKEPLIPPDHLNTALSAGLGEVVEVMMAKARDRRYRSTDDLLVDLAAIAKGSPPPIARKQIDQDALQDLAADAETSASVDPGARAPSAREASTYLLLLVAGLTVSVVLNIVLLMLYAAK